MLRSSMVRVVLASTLVACGTREPVLTTVDGGLSATACTTNVACQEANGPSFVCRMPDHTCINVLSPECPRLLGDPTALASDDVVLLGHLGAPSAAEPLQAEERGVTLAVGDVAATTHGLPAAAPGGTPRPLAVIACDGFMAPNAAMTAARHLVDLHVPAIVSALVDADAEREVAATVTTPAHALLLSVTGVSPEPASDPDLVWRYAPSELAALGIAPAFVGYLESRALARGATTVRAVVIADASTPPAVTDALRVSLRLGGKSPAEAPERFRFVSSPNPAAEVASFQPSIIVHTESAASAASVMTALEKAGAPSGTPPMHLLARVGSAAVLPTIKDEALRARCAAIDAEAPLFDADRANAFALRFRAAFPDGEPGPLAGHGYDAMLALAFAAAKPVDGPGFASALRAFASTGRPSETTPDDLAAAMAALASGTAVDVRASDGAVRWNAAGGRRYQSIVRCVRGGAIVGSGLVFDEETGAVTGAVQCD